MRKLALLTIIVCMLGGLTAVRAAEAPQAPDTCGQWVQELAELSSDALELCLGYAPAFSAQYGRGSAECWLLALALQDCAGLPDAGAGEQAAGQEMDSRAAERQASAIRAIQGLLTVEQILELGLPVSVQAQNAEAAGGPVVLAAPQLEQARDPAGPAPDAPLHMLVFHCPVQFNDGAPVPPELSARLEQLVCAECGGFTVSEVEGAWEDEGKVYREPMRRYLVGIAPDRLLAFQAQVEALIKGDFKQLAVWFEVDGVPEIR